MAPLLYLTLLAGQTPAAPAPGGPTFDVVSIKINNSGDNGGAWGSRCESGRWSGRNIPVSAIIVTAFGLMQAQVAGIPDWDRRPLHQFDITATCPADAVATQIRPMLQAMLANRFHFAGHWETRDLAVRTLEVAKTGVHLQPPSGACVAAAPEAPMPQGEHLCGRFYATRTPLPGPRVDGEPITIRYQAWSASTADFIAYFGRMGRIGQPPMVDETGLTGKYDFDFAYEVIWNAKDDAGHPIDQSYKFDQGLEKRVGLIYNETKLKKKPMPFLVIDHIEMPTPN
ncbi:MAG TPA: TIGR03435 family protein [Terriglobales bacterium]|nr:TIGR03435 family protein [Terriglobales bacterium]